MLPENISTFSRGSAFACVALFHIALIYAIATSLGIVAVPSPPPAIKASFIEPDNSAPTPAPLPGSVPVASRTVLPPEIPNLPVSEDANLPDSSPMTNDESAGAPGSGPMISSEAMTPASVIVVNQPPYPSASIRGNEQGVVVLSVLVGADGRVMDVKVLKSSGYARLDAAARQSARDWKFKAGMQGNISIESWITLPVRFQLRT